MKNLSKCWKSLIKEERAVFEEKAKMDKERYQRDVIIFNLEFKKMKKDSNESQKYYFKNSSS